MPFEYWGAKAELSPLYPVPDHTLIIEPFAGSARYSYLHHRGGDVWLNDRDPIIYRVWKWIQQATVRDVQKLPELKKGQRFDRIKWLSQPERELLGFASGVSRMSSPQVTAWGVARHGVRSLKARLLPLIGQIGHWKITNLDYSDLPDREATWFIDPPYQYMGKTYTFNNAALNYRRLAKWCQQRSGQVIVCEGGTAENMPNWLPFRTLRSGCSRVHRSDQYSELVWYKTESGAEWVAL